MKKTWDNLQAGDILINNYGDERMVLGILIDLVFPSYINDFETTDDEFWHKKELQNGGWTIKQPERQKPVYTPDEAINKLRELGHDCDIKK